MRERIQGMIADTNATQRELAAAALKSHSWIATVVGAKLRSPEGLPLARMCEVYGYNVRYMLTGKGPRRISSADDARWTDGRTEVPAPSGQNDRLAAFVESGTEDLAPVAPLAQDTSPAAPRKARD